MTNKQMATAAGAALVAIAGVLSQCPDEPPPAAKPLAKQRPPAAVDAGDAGR